MKIKFYTEGGKNIGFGHINRCLSLAQAFNELSHQCEFNIRGDDSIINLIDAFKVNTIDWISEPNQMFEELDQSDILIFDSYIAPQKLINDIAKKNRNLVFFDDYRRIDYPTGILINGVLSAASIYTKRNPKIKFLLGAAYQTIRKEFWDVDPIQKSSTIKNVLITFGGDDSRNLTPPVMKFLTDYNPNIIENVIVGKSFSNAESIKNLTNNKTKIFYDPSAKQICEIMRKSDIAICGAGQTLNELARVKSPALFIGIADNQKNNIKSWSNFPYFEFVGWWNSKNIISRLSESFIKFDENFKQISENAYNSDYIIDGNGSKNIVKEVLSYVRTK